MLRGILRVEAKCALPSRMSILLEGGNGMIPLRGDFPAPASKRMKTEV